MKSVTRYFAGSPISCCSSDENGQGSAGMAFVRRRPQPEMHPSPRLTQTILAIPCLVPTEDRYQSSAEARRSMIRAPITASSPCARSVRHRGSIFRLRAGHLSASSLFRLITISTMHTINPRATIGPAVSTVCRMKALVRSLGLTYAALLRAKFDSVICCAL